MIEFGPQELERVLVDALAPTPDAVLIDRPDWVQLTTPSQPASTQNLDTGSQTKSPLQNSEQ